MTLLPPIFRAPNGLAAPRTAGTKSVIDMAKESIPVKSEQADRNWDLGRIAILSDPLSDTSDAIRSVQGRLQRQFLDGGVHSFALVGDVPDSGSSFVAANLAVSFAQAGRQTVLVDANLNSPSAPEFFRVPPGIFGLADWLNSNDATREIGRYGCTPLPNLSFVPAGRVSHVGEPLQQPSLISVMTQLNRMFEVVIYDAPPATDLANLLAIAAIAERTILVGREHKTRIAILHQLQSLIENCHGKVEGVVLTRA